METNIVCQFIQFHFIVSTIDGKSAYTFNSMWHSHRSCAALTFVYHPLHLSKPHNSVIIFKLGLIVISNYFSRAHTLQLNNIDDRKQNHINATIQKIYIENIAFYWAFKHESIFKRKRQFWPKKKMFAIKPNSIDIGRICVLFFILLSKRSESSANQFQWLCINSCHIVRMWCHRKMHDSQFPEWNTLERTRSMCSCT